jgi:hypothetical protein
MSYKDLECKDPEMSWKDFKQFVKNHPDDTIFGVSLEDGVPIGNRVLYYEFVAKAPYRVYGMGTPDPLWMVILDQLQESVSAKSGVQFFPFSKRKVLYLLKKVEEIIHLTGANFGAKAPWRPSYLAMPRNGKHVLRPYVEECKEDYIEQIIEDGYYAQSETVLNDALKCLLFIYYPEYYDIEGKSKEHHKDDIEEEILKALRGTKSKKIDFFHFRF